MLSDALCRRFIKDSANVDDPKVRLAYGRLAGIVGIVCNLLLCGFKLLAGILAGSLAMIADAFNNLSDAGSSIVTLIGFKLAGAPADDDHPFGHGRMEYLSAMGVAILIIIAGFELATSALEKIFNPTAAEFKLISVIILAVSILSLPSILGTFFPPEAGSPWEGFVNAFNQNSWLYIILYALLIVGFAFFYVTIQYNPVEMANNLRKNGGAIPGQRPGKPTADFIKRVLNKVTFIGALFLGVVALFPSVFGKISGIYGLTIGGTSVMIVVGVALETVQQIESQMMMRHYKGFLD